MLYHLHETLRETFFGFNVFKFITFRTFAALMTSMGIFFIFGGWWIRYLKSRQFSQTIRTDGPETNLTKRGTPTMGGFLVIGPFFVSVFLWGGFSSEDRGANEYVIVALFVTVAMAVVGLIDDYRKVIKKNPDGFPGRYKILLEVAIALAAALAIYGYAGLETTLYVPFFKEVRIDLGAWYLPLTVLVIVGCANAVNLTDGLDGLVAVPAITSFLTYGLFVYIVGNKIISGYLQIPSVGEAGEMAVLCGAMVGACVGFLWFNSYPADIFMGDVGALSIGGLLGFMSLVAKQELLLVVIGGLFVLWTLSVITQVASFRLPGQRVFKMAPLHHHFELKGWSEPKIIVRFWIISFLLALLSLATLKLR